MNLIWRDALWTQYALPGGNKVIAYCHQAAGFAWWVVFEQKKPSAPMREIGANAAPSLEACKVDVAKVIERLDALYRWAKMSNAGTLTDN